MLSVLITLVALEMKLAVHECQKTLTTALTDLREDLMSTLDAEFKRIREDIDSQLDGQPSASAQGARFFVLFLMFTKLTMQH